MPRLCPDCKTPMDSQRPVALVAIFPREAPKEERMVRVPMQVRSCQVCGLVVFEDPEILRKKDTSTRLE